VAQAARMKGFALTPSWINYLWRVKWFGYPLDIQLVYFETSCWFERPSLSDPEDCCDGVRTFSFTVFKVVFNVDIYPKKNS
jgi:hypothetical protein